MLNGGVRGYLQSVKQGGAILAILVFFTLPWSIPLAHGTSLDDLEKQKQAAQQQANQYQNQANSQNAQIHSLQDAVNQLNAQIASMQSKIDNTQTQISQNRAAITRLEAQIKDKEAQLADNLAKQAQDLQMIYVMGQESTLESIVSSGSLSEVVARDQYLSALEQKIEQTMATIKLLKQQLVDQKTALQQKNQDLAVLQNQQVAYQATIEYQRNQQAQLLSSTVAQQNAYIAQANAMQTQIDNISAQEYALRRNLSDGGITFGGSGYPFGAIDVPDPWGFYTRECTSYAAWYWNARLGKHWSNVTGNGDARDWPALATAQGYSVSSTPRVGAIVSWDHGAYGHVAIVEKVYSNGNIDVSEYNWTPYIYDYRSNFDPYAYATPRYIY